jgi:hypothetical protein
MEGSNYVKKWGSLECVLTYTTSTVQPLKLGLFGIESEY